ncbi:MAG: carboxypeptidase-like regulatory domain-containing protein [Vicinamibacterales bacterium]
MPIRARRLVSMVAVGARTVAILIGLGGSELVAQQPPPLPQGAISGIVVDAITGAPLAGARVSLSRADDQRAALPRIVTDAKGRFVLRNLPAAKTYILEAARFGYASTRYGSTAPGQSSAIRIDVAEGQWVADIKIPLWRYGSIGGRVIDERNEPVVGVAVRAFTMRPVSGRQQPVAGPLTTTDDRGAYRLGSLEPGSYIVSVLSVQSTVLATTPEVPSGRPVGALAPEGVGGGRGALVASPGIDVDGRHRLVITNYATPPPPASEQARAYPPVFYPASSHPSGAQALPIGYGDVRTGIDIQIAPVPAVRVSGRIDGAAGATPDLLLRLLPAGSESLGFGAEVATTQLEKDGTFTFLNVPAGDYSLLAQGAVLDFVASTSPNTRVEDAPGYPGQRASVGMLRFVPGINYLSRQAAPAGLWGRMSLSVGNVAISDVVLPMRPAVKITGRFVFADDTARPDVTHDMLITAEPTNGDPSLALLCQVDSLKSA